MKLGSLGTLDNQEVQPVDQKRWAGAYYRVEREWSGSVMRKRQRKKATELAIQHGDAPPGLPQDVVRVYDREGEVVFEQHWGSERSGAMAQEAQIVDDLLKLDALRFAAKYGIEDPPEIPPEEEASEQEVGAGEEAGTGGRAEQGSG